MDTAVISGDIVASTSLTDAGRALIEENLQALTLELKDKFDTYSRIIRGDYLECVVSEPQHALRIALAIKGYIKSIHLTENLHYVSDPRIRAFKTHGIRLAIGYGQLSRFNPENGVIDGEAIYLSGRTINFLSTYNKERIVIKNTLYFVSNNETLNNQFEPILALLDVLISKATSKQCKVLYMKLINHNEASIASILNISQAVVNQHSTSLGWNAIEKAVSFFTQTIITQNGPNKIITPAVNCSPVN
jgi:hypothetical protein